MDNNSFAIFNCGSVVVYKRLVQEKLKNAYTRTTASHSTANRINIRKAIFRLGLLNANAPSSNIIVARKTYGDVRLLGVQAYDVVSNIRSTIATNSIAANTLYFILKVESFILSGWQIDYISICMNS